MERTNETNTDNWVDECMAKLEPAGEWHPNANQALAQVRERQRKAARRRRSLVGSAAVASIIFVASLTFSPVRAVGVLCYDAACAVVAPLFTGMVQDPSGPTAGLIESGPAPDFALPDAAGREIRLSDLRGKVVLLNFWATWCVPCRKEMPCFADFQRKYEGQGFTVVAVSLDEEGWEAVRPFADDLNLNFPIVVGNDDVADRFGGIAALPTTFIIDREGQIRSRHTGLVSPRDYEQAIRKLL